jgi:hypothetical protein
MPRSASTRSTLVEEIVDERLCILELIRPAGIALRSVPMIVRGRSPFEP